MLTKNEKAVPPSLPTKKATPSLTKKATPLKPYHSTRKLGTAGCSKIPQRCVIQNEHGHYLVRRKEWTPFLKWARVYSSPARARKAIREKGVWGVVVELPQYK